MNMLKSMLLSALAFLSLAGCQGRVLNAVPSAPTKENLATTTPAEPAQGSAGALCFTPLDYNPISFSPDSRMLAIRGGSGVQIFDLATMKEGSLAEAPQTIVAAALSPDGKHLAWSLEDHSIQLVRIANSKILHTLEGHTNLVFKLRFSADGNQLFSGSHDHSVRIWDSQGGLLHVIETNDEVLGFGVSADGTRLATIPPDGPVELWDLDRYQKLFALGGTGGLDTSDAVFSPDGNYLAADLATGLYLWSLADRKPLWETPRNSLAVAFSPDGRYLAYADTDQNNRVVLSSTDGVEITRTLDGMQGTVWELFFSPDSSMLAATDGGEIRIWQVGDGTLLYLGKPSCP